MKDSSLLRITFVYGDRILAGARSAEIGEPIAIGTDAGCAWKASPDDRTMPPRAATLAMKGGRLVLTAERGAKLRVNGAAVTSAELKAGDRAAVGDGELRVTADDAARRYEAHHRLESVGGDRPGETLALKKDVFTVGRAKEADLRLADDTVSARHATLEMRGEDCFVKDETSRNGTLVNGQRLGGKERLLRDGDVLSFGPFDYRYLDRRAPHVRSNAGRNLLVALLTFLLAGAGWYAFYVRSPHVSQYLEAARNLAAREDFDGADRMLAEARKARGFEDSRATWGALKEKVSVWRTTAANWESFKSNLDHSYWTDAQEQLGTLSLKTPANWDWNDTTLAQRLQEAQQAADLVLLARNFWLGTRLPDWSDETGAQLAAERARLGIDAKDFTDDARDWMLNLKRDVVRRAANYDRNEARYGTITNALACFVHRQEPLTSVTNTVNGMLDDAWGHVRTFAYLVRTPLAKLNADHEMLTREADALTRLDLAHWREGDIRTTPDDCAISTALLEGQQRLVERGRHLEVAAAELGGMMSRLARHGATLQGDPAPLVAFEADCAIEKALACPYLDTARRPPRGDRTAPVDDPYDRLFGYEFLYSYMVEGYIAYPNDVDMAKLVTLNFTPEIRRLYKLSLEIASDLEILKGPEFDGLVKDDLAAFRDRLVAWQARYLAIREHFGRIAASSDDPMDRPSFLARAARIYMTPTKDQTPAEWADFRRRFLAIRTALRARADALDPVHVEEAYAGAEWILKHGIPGSRSVMKAFNYRR